MKNVVDDVDAEPSTQNVASCIFSPTAYGRHLLVVLRCAFAAAPQLFAPAEYQLAAALAALDGPAADLIARCVQRVAPESACAVDASAEVITSTCASGWLRRAAHGGSSRPAEAQQDFLVADKPQAETGIAATAAAMACVRAAMMAAFADDRTECSLLVRLGLGQIALPDASPCAAALRAIRAGTPIAAADPSPFADRATLDAYLVARDARTAGASIAQFDRALAEVDARAGRPLRLLAYHLEAAYHWTNLLWECRALLDRHDPRRALALRSLRRAPLGPGLARLVWTEVHARAAHRSGRMIAAHLATWPIWAPGDRARWRLRASGRRRSRAADGWRTARVSAWLDHADSGAVLAAGERVEQHALRRLAEQGWHGLHAEGGFWLALAGVLFHDEIMDAVPAVWPGPLQTAPLDWGRWGFAQRRAAAIDRRRLALVRDPLTELARTWSRCAGRGLGGSTPPPSTLGHAQEVCRRMPVLTLARLLARVVAEPGEASGLPDLVVWRGDELALWEVKSPGDQLSDRQRAWLAWLDLAGIPAGVLRIDARQSQQQRIAPIGEVSAPRSQPVRAGARRVPAQAEVALSFAADDGVVIELADGARMPSDAGEVVFAGEPAIAVERWRGGLGAAQVDGWERDVVAVRALAVAAICRERRRGAKVLERRWFPLPLGWAVPALMSWEADPAGGMRLCASVLMRASGWLLPTTACDREPVIVRAQEITTASIGTAWRAHPDVEPPQPERRARCGGFADELAAQLALLGSEPHALRAADDGDAVEIALADNAACLWVASDPRIRRVPFAWRPASRAPGRAFADASAL